MLPREPHPQQAAATLVAKNTLPEDSDQLATAYISLGSNLGDGFSYLQAAVATLRQHTHIQLAAASSHYETAPQDVFNQPWFLNQVIAVETNLSPHDLLAFLQQTEREAGRVRSDDSRRGPRTLDLDILLYGANIVETEILTLPHPRLLQRRFVLEPLLEIAPYLVHPVTKLPLSSYLLSALQQPLRRL